MSERARGGHTEKKAIDQIKDAAENKGLDQKNHHDDSNNAFEEQTHRLEGVVDVVRLLDTGNVVNAVILKSLEKDQQARNMAERIIKARFESEDSFGSCKNSADIVKRVQTIIQQNNVLRSLGWSEIVLTNSGGESLLMVKESIGSEPVIIALLKDLERNVSKGKAFVKSLDSYKKITGKYGLKAAIDRWLEPLS